MVNPATFPAQRRGPSGPQTQNGGGGSDFAPFDNERWFDPEYVDSDETGSIAAPFIDWATMVAALGTQGWYVHFPSYPIVPTSEEILVEGQFLFEGSTGTAIASSIDEGITLSSGGTSESVKFRNLHVEAITLTDGGEAPITFENCAVDDIFVDGLWQGEIYGFDSTFAISQETNDCNVHLTGGYVIQWSAQTFELTDMKVGDGVSAGALAVTGPSVTCRGVTFTPGSSINFINEGGTLYLDPESFKSFVDNDIFDDLIGCDFIIRLDGSYPEEAIEYAGTGTVGINWLKNPRAYIEQTGPITLEGFDDAFILTREYTLIVDNTTSGEDFETITFPAFILWSGGTPPEQEEGISVYKFEYEQAISTWFGYVVIMNGLTT